MPAAPAPRRAKALLVSAVLHGLLLLVLGSIVFLQAQPETATVFYASRRDPVQRLTEPPVHPTPPPPVPPTRPEVDVQPPGFVFDPDPAPPASPAAGGAEAAAPDEPLDESVFGPGPGDSGAAGPWSGRDGDKDWAAGIGWNPATEDAVLHALDWLARHQSADGSWKADAYHLQCEAGGAHADRCEGPGGAGGLGRGWSGHNEGVTGLALLAFLGNGHTHKFSPDPRFRLAVQRGLHWLQSRQADDGSIGFKHQPPHGESMYNHALATMALCEAHAVTRDSMLKKPCRAAVDFAVKAQNQVDHDEATALGWKYGIKTGLNDTSVTGWMVLALASARAARLDVPEVAFQGALHWFDQATDARTGLAGYEGPDGYSSFLPAQQGAYDPLPVMTAAALVGRMKCGQPADAPAVRKGLKLLLDNPPRAGAPRSRNMYYWYYGAFAVFEATDPHGPQWAAWNKALLEALLPAQRRSAGEGDAPCADGSWDPDCEWGLAGGRVYATAMGALTLEVYYRY